MSKNTLLFTLVLPMLFSMQCEDIRSRTFSESYVVKNETDKTILITSRLNDGSTKILHVDANREYDSASIEYQGTISVPNMIIYNISDTCLIDVSNSKLLDIFDYNLLETRVDTVILQHLSRSVSSENGTWKWLITNNLLEIMEKDYSMVQLFPEFYMYK